MQSLCESRMHPLWPAATVLSSRYPTALLFCPNPFMPDLNRVCVPEESEADTRREYGHEPFPNDGHRDGAGSDPRLRLLIGSGPVQAVPPVADSSQTPGKRQSCGERSGLQSRGTGLRSFWAMRPCVQEHRCVFLG